MSISSRLSIYKGYHKDTIYGYVKRRLLRRVERTIMVQVYLDSLRVRP